MARSNKKDQEKMNLPESLEQRLQATPPPNGKPKAADQKAVQCNAA
jgi:hypothetical protein